MKQNDILKYTVHARILHWVHTASYLTLFFTGMIMFLPGLRTLAESGMTRSIHHAAATFFLAYPLFFLVIRYRSAWDAVKSAFIWGADDAGWVRAAPRYYLLGEDSGMPPQNELNTGQKGWWLLTLLSGIVFAVSGLIMAFGKVSAPPALLQWMVTTHDIAFIATGALMFLHIYLGLFHPRMTEAWRSMTSGKVSAEYAVTHHRRWYNKVKEEQGNRP